MDDPIDNINSQQDLEHWFSRWCTQNHIASVKSADGSYVDESLNTTWRALLDLFSPRLKQIEEKENRNHATLNVDGLISLLSTSPDSTIDLYSPKAEEDHDGNVILTFQRSSDRVYFAEMQQTLEYLKGSIFRNYRNKPLVVSWFTPVYLRYDDGENCIAALTRSKLKFNTTG